jgi:hypothetical protein
LGLGLELLLGQRCAQQQQKEEEVMNQKSNQKSFHYQMMMFVRSSDVVDLEFIRIFTERLFSR